MGPHASSQGRPAPTQGTSYDDVKAGKAPIAIQVAPKPSQARLDLHPMHRAASSSSPELDHPTHASYSRLQEQEPRRDSGLGTAASKRESRATTVGTDKTDTESTISGRIRSIKQSPSLPRIGREDSQESPTHNRSFGKVRAYDFGNTALKEAVSLDTLPHFRDSVAASALDLPSFSLEDLSSLDAVQFSKRGSILLGGQRPSSSPTRTSRLTSPTIMTVSPASPTIDEQAAPVSPIEPLSPSAASHLNVPEPVPRPRELTPSSDSRALSMDEEALSQKIRSMYIHDRGKPSAPDGTTTIPTGQDAAAANGLDEEDDVTPGSTDRYGFVITKPPPVVSLASPGASYVSLNSTATAPEGMGISRMATQLRLAAETPRRNRSFRSRIGRSPSNAGSAKSTPNRELDGRQSSASNRTSRFLRPTSSQASYRTATTVGTSRVRRASNHLPYNKARKYVDEAGDMLTLPPGLAEIAESEALSGKSAPRVAQKASAKEREREEKWRKMAKEVKTSTTSGTTVGGGMEFVFDASSPKVISRTWKGIPDRWRGSAWWSFMESSAKKRPDCDSAEKLGKIFHELVKQPCADDMQIDLDVPRTIGGHADFRRRYQDGQRLLFRVLHALALHFPDPGYVQGMAAIAATLLLYFNEERTFVMLVRMWELRGLAKLYRAGFEGLMGALNEFEVDWLAGGIVGEKLKELCIPPTSYGTRWYLTLFNYSVPFSAQVRIWDIFLLLGDANQLRHLPTPAQKRSVSAQPSRAGNENAVKGALEAQGFDGCLDVLHAVAAALIDGTRDILLDSDFDNAMKTLTSWIPIRDDELLMKVAKVEYKYHKKRR